MIKTISQFPIDLVSKIVNKIVKAFKDFLSDSMAQYIVIIVIVIGVFAILQPIYDNLIQSHYPNLPKFISDATINNIDYDYIEQFLQWFGVLYGFLLPLILVRVWEQFDDIDNVFDREADAIKILAEDMLLLRDNFSHIRETVLNLLLQYTVHVRDHHLEETILERKMMKKGKSEKDTGAEFLKQIRDQYKVLIHQSKRNSQEVAPLISELLDKLNTIIDLRGDRISLSTQRLFESLKLIAIVTTILWIVPLYFILFTGIGLLNILLTAIVIFLVIVILSIIDDLDKPFDGFWRVDIESWEKLVGDLDDALNNIQKNNINENATEKPKPTKRKTKSEPQPAKRSPRSKKSSPTATPPTQSEIVLQANDNQEKPGQPQLNTGT